MNEIKIAERSIGPSFPTYFIADIAANHDGDLERAKMLIHLAKEKGADAAKFQNFRAPKIVSQEGFDKMGRQLSHQAKWKKSVFKYIKKPRFHLNGRQYLKRNVRKLAYIISPLRMILRQ
jgi:N-acetylneuraminate synthase